MLVFLDTTGAIVATAPKSVGRNSAAMSTIYIVAPISGAAVLSLSFRLPNGDEVNPTLADTVHNAVEILAGVPLPASVRVWSYAVPSSVTRIAGTVTYTITTHTESMTGTGSGTFVVAPATTKTMPNTAPAPDVWDDILAELSKIYKLASDTIGNTEVKTIDGERITTVTALLADLVALIGKDGAESPIGGSTTITTLLEWVKDEALRLAAIIGSGSIPFAETITEAINALNEAKVSKTSEASAIYGTDDKGNPTTIPYSVGVKYDGHGNATSIPLRDNSGHVKTADPIAVDDAVSLGYYNREVWAITDGLRELDNIVKGRSRALVFDNWEDALVAITSKGAEDLQIGDAILIRDLGAPDAWISGISPNYDPYPGGIGVTNPFGDNALTFVVGWYAISPLESPKVNLDEYAKEDDLNRLTKEVANLRANIPPEYFTTDSAVEYIKQVPAAALPFAEVQEVGGMTYAEDGTLQNAAVTALESVGVNILDISAALNSCLTDNGDGTYTITRKTSSDRFSAIFPLYIPVNGRIYAYVEIVTSYDGFNGSIPLQIFGEDGKTEIGAASLANNGSGFALANGSHYARLYLNTNAPIGVPVTFRKPMVKYGTAGAPYAPYVKRTYPIPAEAQALDGWGEGISADCHNRIDWEKKQYRQEVWSIRIDGSEAWNKSAASNIFQAYTPLSMNAGDTKSAPAIVSNGYGFLHWYTADESAKPYFRIGLNSNQLWIEATLDQFASTDAWKAYLSANPVEIVYPLAEPIVTDLPNLPDDTFIAVEGGGTITAVNEHGLAAPTKIEYQLKEVTA